MTYWLIQDRRAKVGDKVAYIANGQDYWGTLAHTARGLMLKKDNQQKAFRDEVGNIIIPV